MQNTPSTAPKPERSPEPTLTMLADNLQKYAPGLVAKVNEANLAYQKEDYELAAKICESIADTLHKSFRGIAHTGGPSAFFDHVETELFETALGFLATNTRLLKHFCDYPPDGTLAEELISKNSLIASLYSWRADLEEKLSHLENRESGRFSRLFAAKKHVDRALERWTLAAEMSEKLSQTKSEGEKLFLELQARTFRRDAELLKPKIDLILSDMNGLHMRK